MRLSPTTLVLLQLLSGTTLASSPAASGVIEAPEKAQPALAEERATRAS